jgi:hypothetical protein
MTTTLAKIPISKGRCASIVKGRSNDNPEQLYIWFSTYRETDHNGNPISVEPGAVNKVLGAPLTKPDYVAIAQALLNAAIVGERVANCSGNYAALLKTGAPTRFSEEWTQLLRCFEFAPPQEVPLLALRVHSLDIDESSLPQPFETT